MAEARAIAVLTWAWTSGLVRDTAVFSSWPSLLACSILAAALRSMSAVCGGSDAETA